MEKQILVIDDEVAVRNSFELALEDTRYALDTAATGEEGVAKIREGAFQLIFLDLKMPGMDGVETFRQIRKLDDSVPVYIITAFAKEFYW